MMNDMGEKYYEIRFIIVLGSLLLIALFGFLMTFMALYQRRHSKHLVEKQLLQSQHQQDLLRTQLEIQEQTLKTISEEIHDNLSQTLGLAKLNLHNLLATLPDGPAKPKAEAAKDAVARASNDLRQLARILHGDKVAETGLEQAIDAQLSIIRNSGQFQTGLVVTGEPIVLSVQQEMVLFRMAQELLHNAVKHSGGSRIDVQLDYAPDRLLLSVCDNGQGYDPSTANGATTGIGLGSLQSRAALVGATVTVNTAPGSGTTVAIGLTVDR
jgi:two-component system, NarL family, sensor kinase